MKKILILLLALTVLLALAACGEEPQETPSDEEQQTETAPDEGGDPIEEATDVAESETDAGDAFVLNITETEDTMIWQLS